MCWTPSRRLVAAFAACLASCGPVGASGYESVACAEDLVLQGRQIECGEITLPEDRAAPSGRRVVLPVVIVRARNADSQAPPVFYLHGGPGGGVVADVAQALQAPEWAGLVGQQQDWIFFDQRGSGQARPFLGCGGLPLTDAGPASADAATSLQACLRKHAEGGVNLARYTSIEVVRDLQDLRKALGIATFDVYALSYGTRVAFDLLLHAPEGVRAVVLDSPWPPEASWTETGPVWVSRAWERVLELCEQDAACGARYPGLGLRLRTMVRSQLDVIDAKPGARDWLGRLSAWMTQSLYDRDDLEKLPINVWRVLEGDASILGEDAPPAAAGYAEAAHLAFLCNEELPFERAGAGADLARGDPLAEAVALTMTNYFSTCRAMAEPVADRRENAAVKSDASVLMLAAGIDPGCPPELAQAAIRGLSHGRLGVAPYSTHGVAGHSACARRAIAAFLSDPSASLDLDCLRNDPLPPEFEGTQDL